MLSNLASLRISTPKLIRVGEKCIIDWKCLGVLIPYNASEFQYMLIQKLTIILKILKSENLYNSEHMCIQQLNKTVPRGL